MQGTINVYHPPAGAPFHVGAIVKVIGDSDREWATQEFIGEVGTIQEYDYHSGVGQAVPDNPLLIVRFFGGRRQGFWPEELVELKPVDAAANVEVTNGNS